MKLPQRFWIKIDRKGALVLRTRCWHWIAGRHRVRGKETYGSFCLDGRKRLAHQLVWLVICGPIAKGLCVLHRCDNTQCVRPSHLFLGTRLENNADKLHKGRQARGESNGMSKLKMKAVREIQKSKEPLRALARRHDVSEATVSRIRTKKIWRHAG